jgi:hypothetical protein
MRMVVAIATALVGALLNVSSGIAFTGTQLYQQCIDEPHSMGSLACLSYVRGLIDGVAMGTVFSEQYAGRFCPPKGGLDANQARLIVEKYLKDHPEKLHLEAGIIASIALLVAFPCPKNSN